MSWTRFFRRNRRDEDTAREIASYIAIETDENLARGMTPQAAHDAAVRKFGNATQVREEIYWMNTIRPLDTLWHDLRFGIRLLWRDKGFAVAAIVSLALGIGANTAIFQLLDAVRLRSLPVETPQQLVNIRFPRGSKLSGSFSSRMPYLSVAQIEQLRAQPLDDLFSGLFWWSSGRLNTAAGGEAKYVEALWASGDMFRVLGVRPSIGRLIDASDDRAGCGSPPAVISHAFWQRAFGGSHSVLGQTVRLEGRQFDIVGVTEPDFFGMDVGRRFDVAIPVCADALLNPSNRVAIESRSHFWLSALGRLQPGRTVQHATDRLIAISPALTAATVPDWYTTEDQQAYRNNKLNAFAADSGLSDLRTQFAQPLLVLLGATGLVLVIACANLANLLLARATARQKEIAVRLAIGASRGRIVRQLIVESVLIAAVGTLLAVGVAKGLTAVLMAQLASGMSGLFLNLDWNMTVFAFTAGVAATACLLFGVAPALQATALAPSAALKAGGRGVSDGRERFSARRVLVVAQVALSLVLLFGALLFTRTLYNVLTIDAGFDRELVYLELSHPSLTTDDAVRHLLVRNDIQQRIETVPGVQGAVLVNAAPLTNNWWNENVYVDGSKQRVLSNFATVGTNYFDVLRIPILKGRGFTHADTLSSVPVAVINETFARKLFNGADPIGKQLWVEVAEGKPIVKREIVGVARDTKYAEIKDDFEPLVHLPLSQNAEGRYVRLLVKPRGTLDGLLPALVRRIAEINPEIAIETTVISQAVRDGLVRERLMAALSAAFGALAGLLAAVGIYGVMSYTVTRRRNEIAIRLAMGAARSEVLRMVIADSGKLIVIGLVIGAAMGLGAARAARTLLFGLQPTDPITIAAAVTMLALIGLLASYIPARRASLVDPMSVLRQE